MKRHLESKIECVCDGDWNTINKINNREYQTIEDMIEIYEEVKKWV